MSEACRLCDGGGSHTGPGGGWDVVRLDDGTTGCRCTTCGTWWDAWETDEEIRFARYAWAWARMSAEKAATAAALLNKPRT